MKTNPWLHALWVLSVFALHQDFWNWTKAGPLLFGPLPPGLTYHLGYSVLAAITMALLMRFAWPAMFMGLGSAFGLALVSLLTPAPSRATIEKFFPSSKPTLLPST